MSRKQRTQVLVVGAGPVGLFAASELVRRKIDVKVLDQAWRGTGFSYALALHPRSLELFEPMGLAEPLAEAGYRVNRVIYHEGAEPRTILDYGDLDSRYPFLTIIPQNWLELTLEDWLRKHKVKIQWKHRVTRLEGDRPTEAHVERWGEDMAGYGFARRTRVIEKIFPIEADLVLGADGHSSIVRHQLGIDLEEAGPSMLLAVFEFQSNFDPGHDVHIVFDHGRTSILWPLPDRRFRWGFELTGLAKYEGERIKSRLSEIGHWETPGLDTERLRSLIAERAPWFDGSVEEMFWSAPIRFERQIAPRFGQGGRWLAGDSAHLANPAGIHSMNVGLLEAHDLAGRFQAVLESGGVGELEAYNAERVHEWNALINGDVGLNVLPTASEFVKKHGRQILTSCPATGSELHGLLERVGLEFTPQPASASM
jgi:2-polyprenyl-6-methoxyphenol hydroxylase-like FAD-dependent oxidoreductase